MLVQANRLFNNKQSTEDYYFLIKTIAKTEVENEINKEAFAMQFISFLNSLFEDEQFKVKTYQILPINNLIQLIEFCPNTSTLKSIFDKQIKAKKVQDYTKLNNGNR